MFGRPPERKPLLIAALAQSWVCLLERLGIGSPAYWTAGHGEESVGIGESIGESIRESIGELIGETIGETIGESIGQDFWSIGQDFLSIGQDFLSIGQDFWSIGNILNQISSMQHFPFRILKPTSLSLSYLQVVVNWYTIWWVKVSVARLDLISSQIKLMNCSQRSCKISAHKPAFTLLKSFSCKVIDNCLPALVKKEQAKDNYNAVPFGGSTNSSKIFCLVFKP